MATDADADIATLAWQQMDYSLRHMQQQEEHKQEAQRKARELQSGMHVCPGPHCPHVTADRSSSNSDCTYVCSLSGICYGQRLQQGWDDSSAVPSGRDPEGASFLPVKRQRRDMLRASLVAYMNAPALEDSTQLPKQHGTRSGRPLEKRSKTQAAKESPVACCRRRAPTANSVVPKAEVCMAQAFGIVDRIIRVSADSHKRRQSNTADRARARARASEQEECPVPSRFFVDARRYVKECQSVNDLPCMHELHSMLLAHVCLAKKRTSDQVVNTECVRRDEWYLRVRTLLCRLIVVLWTTVSQSYYMRTRRRAGDSFKQFAVGVVYGMRRGITTRDGIVIVPQCPRLCKALPSMRLPTEKQNHASSFRMSAHRGLSTLQRSIASIGQQASKEEQARTWQDASRAAQALQKGHDAATHDC